MIAICMINIANAQQKNLPIPNLGKDAINHPLHENLPNHTTLKQKATNAITWNFDTIVDYDLKNLKYHRTTQSFDNFGNVLTQLSESWYNSTWINYDKYTYTYDANGNLLIELNEHIQVKNNKTTFTYDVNGNRLTQLHELWQNNIWENDSKTTFTYDANGNLLIELDESWENNAWINNLKSTYTYNVNGNLLTSLSEVWQNNAWLNSGNDTYSFDVNGNLLTEIDEVWQNNAWANNNKYTYTYDANGNYLTDLWEHWQNNSWVVYSKNTYTYDIDENLICILGESWENNTWLNANKFTFIYDTHGNSIAGKYEIWQNNNWLLYIGGNLGVYSSEGLIYDLGPIARYEAHFVSFTTGIIENNNKPINIYPNPATSKLTINLQQLTKLQNTTVSIYDVQGKLLLQQNITQPQTELNIASLAKGIYVVKINNDTNSMQSKFVKE